MKQQLKAFLKDEAGLGTVELVLLVLILAGLAIAFKGAIKSFFEDLVEGFNASNFVEGTKFK